MNIQTNTMGTISMLGEVPAPTDLRSLIISTDKSFDSFLPPEAKWNNYSRLHIEADKAVPNQVFQDIVIYKYRTPTGDSRVAFEFYAPNLSSARCAVVWKITAPGEQLPTDLSTEGEALHLSAMIVSSYMHETYKRIDIGC